MFILLLFFIKFVFWRVVKGGGGFNNNYRFWEISNKNKFRIKFRFIVDNEDFMFLKIIIIDINIVYLIIMFLENLINFLYLNFDYGL